MKTLPSVALIAALLFSGNLANATHFYVRLVSLSNGIWYSPFLVVEQQPGSLPQQACNRWLRAATLPAGWRMFRPSVPRLLRTLLADFSVVRTDWSASDDWRRDSPVIFPSSVINS